MIRSRSVYISKIKKVMRLSPKIACKSKSILQCQRGYLIGLFHELILGSKEIKNVIYPFVIICRYTHTLIHTH